MIEGAVGCFTEGFVAMAWLAVGVYTILVLDPAIFAEGFMDITKEEKRSDYVFYGFGK